MSSMFSYSADDIGLFVGFFFTLEYVDLICLVSFNTFFFFTTILRTMITPYADRIFVLW